MKYEFIRVPVTHSPKSKPTDLAEQKVHELAAKGWRLIQVLVENPGSIWHEYVLIVEQNSEA